MSALAVVLAALALCWSGGLTVAVVRLHRPGSHRGRRYTWTGR